MGALQRLRRLEPQAKVGLLLIVVMVGLSAVIPTFSPHTTSALVGTPFQPPSGEFLFGTDNLGRDVFVRTFAAGRVTISLAVVGVLIPFMVGTLIGGVTGTTSSRIISNIWTMLIDGINAFPLIILVIAVVAVVGPGVSGLLIAILVTSWARYARIARARALIVSKTEFVQALTLLGYKRRRVIFRHVLPNVFAETRAYAMSDFVIIVLAVAGLSFVGLGVRPPTPEWGSMMNDGRLFLTRAPWMVVFPGLALSLTATGVALLADSSIIETADGQAGADSTGVASHGI
jgi:peptide/nickel transport system permease protein